MRGLAAAIALAAALGLLARCGPRPVAPPAGGGGPAPVVAAIGDDEGLRVVDLAGGSEPRTVLLGRGWRGAAWVGCTDFLAIDREIDGERSLSVLDVGSGRLFPAAVRTVDELLFDPAILDALVTAFGEDELVAQERVALGELRRGPDGRPVVTVLAEAPEETVLVALEPVPLAPPVERAVVESAGCPDAPGVRWVFRSRWGRDVLAGADASGWRCVRVAGEGPAAAEGVAGPAAIGTTARAVADRPLTLDVCGGAEEVVFPGSAPVDGYEACASPEGVWMAVRVEQPGLNGFDVLYVVRCADAAVLPAGRYDAGDPVAGGIGAVGAGVLVAGGPGGWFVARLEGDPEPLGNFVPAFR